jgi:hypothetical protein
MHENETIALEWERQAPNTYWKTAKTYVQDFLSDVAAASNQLVNPYSDATQYSVLGRPESPGSRGV